MDEYESLSHSKWECKYHVVFIPKCRIKTLYGELRPHLGDVFRKLALQKESRVEDFIGQAFNALVQPALVAGQILDNPHHARRQNIRPGGEDDRQLAWISTERESTDIDPAM